YCNGAQLSYTLHAYMPIEGWRIAFNRSQGPLAAGGRRFVKEEPRRLADRQAALVGCDPSQEFMGGARKRGGQIRIYPVFGGAAVVDVPPAAGDHGGGDVRLRDMLFRDGVADPWNHLAGSRAGAMSILTGVAANRSMALGRPVMIEELLQDETAQVGA